MEIVRHLTIAFFYGLGYYFHKQTDDSRETRNEILMRNFLKQLQTHHKQERKLEFYADKLCLSAKYLSQTIKNSSGKTAGEWIDEYVMLEAKALLKSTNMTIQQISDELNFPSQSFFGKFLKDLQGFLQRHIGNKNKMIIGCSFLNTIISLRILTLWRKVSFNRKYSGL